jgi:DNA-binding CsgD family transcriptional regulator/tetratricopeptide (TPR) repeat protein
LKRKSKKTPNDDQSHSFVYPEERRAQGQASILISQLSILDGVDSLLNKSLLRQEEDVGGESRFTMLETIRQYAREKLLELGEGEQVRDRHLEYFLRLAELAEPELTGPNQVAWLDRLELELDNLRAALGWSLERNVEAGLRLAGALGMFWVAHGYFRDGYEWLAQLLLRPAAISPTAARAKALIAQSGLTIWYDYGRGYSLAEESLALYRELGDRQGVARSLSILGTGAGVQDDYALARSRLAESLALYRALGDKLGIADVLCALGGLADNPDYLRDRAYLEESLAIYRELGHLAGIGSTLSKLGYLALRQDDYTLARPWLEEGLALWRTVGERGWGTRDCLSWLGELALRQGDYAQARAYLEESLFLEKETGQIGAHPWTLLHLGYVALREGDVSRARAMFAESQQQFNAAGWKNGVVFSLEGLASLAVMQGKAKRAVRLFAWTDAMREAIGDRRPPDEQAHVDRDMIIIHSQLDEIAFSAAYAEGRTMIMEHAITYALDQSSASETAHIPPSTGPLAPSVAYPAGLTRREVEVLRLIAQGLTDAQVAERLVVSAHTVHAHLRSIYGKLEVTSRAAATRFAVDHHLV